MYEIRYGDLIVDSNIYGIIPADTKITVISLSECPAPKVSSLDGAFT